MDGSGGDKSNTYGVWISPHPGNRQFACRTSVEMGLVIRGLRLTAGTDGVDPKAARDCVWAEMGGQRPTHVALLPRPTGSCVCSYAVAEAEFQAVSRVPICRRGEEETEASPEPGPAPLP